MNNVIDLSPSALFVSRFTPSKIPSTQTSFSTFTPEPPTLITTVHTVTPTLQVVSQVSEKDNMVMVYVPAGEFTMGGDWHLNEQPIHQVYLDGFWIDQTEVTNAMYAKFLNDNLSKIKIESNVSVTTDPPNKDVNLSGNLIYHLVCTDCIAGWKDHISWNEKVFSVVPGFENSPVVFVNWYGTEAYCSWAGRELPTEAQWEKAARGPNGDIYPWGNDRPNNNFLKLNYNGSGFLTGEVGKYPDGASIYGALDMAGNVSEWVGDWYDENYYKYSPSLNPSGPISGDFRVFRGRTCFSNDESALSYYRDGCTPSWSFSDVGFRCALASP